MVDSCDPEAVLFALSVDSDMVTERLEALGIPSPRPTLAPGPAPAAGSSKHTTAWGSAAWGASSSVLKADSPEDWTADITQEEVVDFCQPPGDQVVIPQRTRTNSTEVAGDVGWRCIPSAPTGSDDLDDGATSDTSIRCTARTPALRISPFQYDDQQPTPPKPEPFVLIPTPSRDVMVQEQGLDEATMHALYGMVAADTDKQTADVAGPSTFSSVIRHRLALLQAFRQQRMRQLRPPPVDTGELLVAGAESGVEDRVSLSPTAKPIVIAPSPVRMTFDPKNFSHPRRAETAQPASRRTIIVNSNSSQSRGSPSVDPSAPPSGERDPSFWLTLGRSGPSPIAPGKIRPTTAKIVHAARK